MSYPLTIHALVIEDDEGAKEAYKGIFESITSRGHRPSVFGSSSFLRIFLRRSSHLFRVEQDIPRRCTRPSPSREA